MEITRRTFIGGILASWGWCSLSISAEIDSIPFAARIFLNGDDSETDLAETLRQLSKIGFQGIELSGDFVCRAKEIKGYLDETGLVCVATHVGVSDLLGARFDEVAQSNQILQNQNLIVSGGLDRPLGRKGSNCFTSYFFNRLAYKAGDAGLRIGLCSRPGHFAQIEDGLTAWDSFFRQTAPCVIAELDIKACTAGKTDPLKVIQGTSERVELISIPDDELFEEDERKFDWPRFGHFCRTVGNIKYFVLELEANNGLLHAVEKIAGRFETVKDVMGCL